VCECLVLNLVVLKLYCKNNLIAQQLFDPLRPSKVHLFFFSALSLLPLCVVLCPKSCTFGNLVRRLCSVVSVEGHDYKLGIKQDQGDDSW